MYERFTDRARKVMQLANQEAQRFNHEYIGTEHILLGILKEGSSVATEVLKNLEVDLPKVRREVEKIVEPGPERQQTGELPQTPRAKQVIEYSVEGARSLGHNYVGTEHLFLGLLRAEEGVAAQVLTNLGLKLEGVQEQVLNLLGPSPPDPLESGRLLVGHPARQEKLRRRQEELQRLPADIRQAVEELDSEIEEIRQMKEPAIADQDFVTAAIIRDQTDRLKKKRDDLIRRGREKSGQEPPPNHS